MTQNRKLAEVVQLLDIYFKQDPEKISEWLCSPNKMFGGSSPVAMILNGRGQKLVDFITNQGKEEGWINDVQEQDSKRRGV